MTDTTQTYTGKKRGRKPLVFEFPVNAEFKVRELSRATKASVPYIHIRMKEAGKAIQKVRDEKIPGRKGRAAGVYIYNPETATAL